MDKSLAAKLCLVFFSTQLVGLLTAQNLLAQDVSVTIISDDKQGVENSFGLTIYIIVFTAVLLFVSRMLKGRLLFFFLKAFEILAVFGTSLLVFSIAGDIPALALALLLVFSRIAFSKNVLLRNVSSVIAASGAGALIGVSLGIIPVIVFMVLLSVYDYIAVFKTKHMVEIAKNVTSKNLSFTFALPSKNHQFELGTGDIVVPLTFAVSVLAEKKMVLGFPDYFVSPLAIIFASFIALVFTLEYVSKRAGTALPALPPQTALMLAVFFASSFLGF